jgi:competence protein ComEA
MVRIALSLLAFTCLMAAAPARAVQPPPKTADSAPAAKSSTARRSSAAKPVSTTLVNINTASAAEFETLPGVGAKMAARIIEYRQKNGGFKKVEELMNVRGVGEKNFLKLKGQLTLGAPKASDR